MPTPIAGVKPWKGKKNPVTLVSNVVNRKSAVQPSNRFAVSRPYATRKPARMAIKLITTCTLVNVVRTENISVPLVFAGSLERSFVRRYSLLRRHAKRLAHSTYQISKLLLQTDDLFLGDFPFKFTRIPDCTDSGQDSEEDQGGYPAHLLIIP